VPHAEIGRGALLQPPHGRSVGQDAASQDLLDGRRDPRGIRHRRAGKGYAFGHRVGDGAEGTHAHTDSSRNGDEDLVTAARPAPTATVSAAAGGTSWKRATNCAASAKPAPAAHETSVERGRLRSVAARRS